jgi:hypothetical protein
VRRRLPPQNFNFLATFPIAPTVFPVTFPIASTVFPVTFPITLPDVTNALPVAFVAAPNPLTVFPSIPLFEVGSVGAEDTRGRGAEGVRISDDADADLVGLVGLVGLVDVVGVGNGITKDCATFIALADAVGFIGFVGPIVSIILRRLAFSAAFLAR